MILWFQELPKKTFDEEWKPFINSKFFRANFMKIVYILMFILAVITYWYSMRVAGISLLFIIPVFIIHEICHIIVIYNLGDVSVTFKGLFFWINTNAEMGKWRFLLFMSLPIILLSLIPFGVSFCFDGNIKNWLVLLSLINMTIASSDIINSMLILSKPLNTLFSRGYYKVK